MSPLDWIGAASLAAAALLAAGSAAGALTGRDGLERLHYTTAASLAAVPAAVGALMVVGDASAAGKLLLVALVSVVGSPLVAHGAVRAARLRSGGAMVPPDAEREPS